MEQYFASDTAEFEVQTDVLTLLENVKCQGHNPSGLKQALSALATICNTSPVSQEYFCMAGGVEELKILLLEGSCPELAVPAALYCLACAVRQNVISQNAVLREDMMTMIHEHLSDSDSDDMLVQAAAFLLACAVAGSSRGQLLAYETGCLQDLLHLLRECIATGCDDEDKWSVIKTIGVCVNNPQSAHNQQICCSLLPHTLKFISTKARHKCVHQLFILISLVVANNASNQDRIRRCSGIEILVQFIQKQVCGKDICSVPISLLANAVSAVDACIADSEESGVRAGKLGLVPVLLDLLEESDLELCHVQIFILTLAHLLESSNEYCQLVTKGRGYHVLINVLTDSQDEELCKVIKYIFTLCKNKGDVPLYTHDHEEDNADILTHSARDLSTLLKEGLSALSNQLNTIEKVSENIQWMKSMGATCQPMKKSKFQIDEPTDKSCTEKMMPDYNMSEESFQTPDSVDVFQQNRSGRMPHASNQLSSFDGNIAHNRARPSPSDPYTVHKQKCVFSCPSLEDARLFRDQQQIAEQNSSTDRTCHTGSKRCVVSRVTRFDTRRQDTQDNCSGAHKKNWYDRHAGHNMRLGENGIRSSNPGSSTQSRHIGDGPACEGVLKSTVHSHGTVGSHNVIVHSGLHNPSKLSVCAGNLRDILLSVCDDDSQVGSADNIKNNLDIRRNRRTRLNVGSSIEMPDINFPEQQDKHQGHTLEETESGNMDQHQFCNEPPTKKYQTWDNQTPSHRKNNLCCETHAHQENKEVLPSNLLCYMQHSPAITDLHCQGVSVNDCREPSMHQRRTVSASSEHCDLGNGTNMHRARAETSHYAHNIFNAKTHNSVQSSPSQLSIADFHHVQSATNTCSVPVNDCTYEENTSLSTCVSPNETMSPHENQLFAKLQKVMSFFFKSLMPEVASLPTQTETRNKEQFGQHTDGSFLTSLPVEIMQEHLHHSDMSVGPSTSTENIFPVCEIVEDNNQEVHCVELYGQTFEMKESIKDPAVNIFEDRLSDSFKENSNVLQMQTEPCNQQGKSHNVTSRSDNTTNDKEDCSIKAVTSLKDTFVKPSQLHPSQSHAKMNHRTSSNVRLARAPLSASISVKSLINQRQQHHQPPPPSPALSQFDTQIKKMAHLGTAHCNMKAGNCRPITNQSDESTSGFESVCTSEANGNVASVWSASGRSKTPESAEKSSSHQAQFRYASIPQPPEKVACVSLPLYRRNVACLSTPQPLLCMDKHLQPQKIANTDGNPYRPAKWMKETYRGIRKGCAVGFDLNSYTYNIAIETSVHTCTYHRNVRHSEKEYIHQKLTSRASLKKNSRYNLRDEKTTKHDVYDFESDSMECTPFPTLMARGNMATSARRTAFQKQDIGREVRRPRVLYTQQELLNLLEGVAKMGQRWQQILCTYEFHPSRTAVDLKDKYKQLKIKQQEQEKSIRTKMPFSMCEIRRLKKGVKHLGYNWTAILKHYKFLPGRTAAVLHNQWRSLNEIKARC